MEQKNIVATIYIKDGYAVKDPAHTENKMDVLELARLYNDSGIDKIICYDLSDSFDEHEKNIQTIKEINRIIDIKTAGGGNIKRLDDVKKFIYAGCVEVVLNGSKPESVELLKAANEKFGKDKILVSLKTIDFIFKTKEFLEDNVHELIIYNDALMLSLEGMTDVPYILDVPNYDFDYIREKLSSDKIRGICGAFLNNREEIDVMQLKCDLSDAGIKMDNFEPKLSWSDLKVNSDGLVPVVVQDFQTLEVLMVAYMNEESFNQTIRIGKMTYWSRSRQELWLKGDTSGHYQYVKSLTADCDFDTILAKVSQVGAACHTGSYSCFFNEIVKKEFTEKNPLKIFETVYDIIVERRMNPKADSYTNDLFDRGEDEILKKLGEEAISLVIAAKNLGNEGIKEEMSDFMYLMMVLMVKYNITWEDITRELLQR
ncbi:MAG: bifunctional phosphoribosyl-AMP cyclohydrolase/phosphoribosyl-ATP diphosphatase HisIE [Lachnospiraceae bacterium]|nr:bifunctional phosphoribosyl-AMP cyclohydrolase/phosphoribosyl-ATP diphosphatase HisIE [Lachnospiraceae bacterium]